MNIPKKIIVLPFMVFCLHTSADELSLDLQKSCVKEQLTEHKGIKGHSFQDSDFKEYCKCETDFILEKARQDQKSQINKKQATNSKWFKQLKSKAIESCTEPKQQTST
jgi:hypothetical protein